MIKRNAEWDIFVKNDCLCIFFSRGDKPPSKELLRLFIRTYAIRAGQTASSPWIVDDAQVRKLDLQSKFASFLLSPVKVTHVLCN